MNSFLLTNCFQYLEKTHSLMGCAVVGVGRRMAPWIDFLSEREHSSVLLIDAESAILEAVAADLGGTRGWQYEHRTLSRYGGQQSFYNVANRAESSLVHWDNLRELWPGTRPGNEAGVHTHTLDDVLRQNAIDINWLVLDCLPGVELIDWESPATTKIEVVITRAVLECDATSALATMSLEQTIATLSAHGFVCVGFEPERHPRIVHGVFARSNITDHRRLHDENSALKKNVSQLSKEKEQLLLDNKKLQAQFGGLLPGIRALEKTLSKSDETVQYFHHLNKSIEQSGIVLGIADDEIVPARGSASAEAPVSKTTQASGINGRNGRYSLLELKLLQFVFQQKNEIASLRHHVETSNKKHANNMMQQLESYQGIQYFLKEGAFLPNMHVWPVSPDFGLSLMELVASNDYDLILEFGSGTSTLLMAQTIYKSVSTGKSRKSTVQVAFEHLEKYHESTVALLARNGVEKRVRVELAPLELYVADDGVEYQYYSCREVLAELANLLRRAGLKILMMVDGPPGNTNPHARYPALPLVLTEFADAYIDLYLDDYQRKDEKEIVQMWKKDIKALGLSYSQIERKLEKDACLLQIKGEPSVESRIKMVNEQCQRE